MQFNIFYSYCDWVNEWLLFNTELAISSYIVARTNKRFRYEINNDVRLLRSQFYILLYEVFAIFVSKWAPSCLLRFVNFTYKHTF